MKLRRAEFERARYYRRRQRRRWPLSRHFRQMTTKLVEALRSVPPEFSWLKSYPTELKEAGIENRLDLAVAGPSTTQATSRDVVPVNYGATATARPRFFRSFW